MRKHFAAYVRPGPHEFAELHGGIFSLDANVLLNLYRYSPETRDEFLRLLEKLQPQLWLTHQAAEEFHRLRLRVITSRLGMLTEARNKLQAAKADLDPKLVDVYRAPSRQSKSRLAKVRGAWGALESYIQDLDKEAVRPTSDPADDLVWSRLVELFDDRVGEPYPADKRRQLEAEGKDRYSRRIPPGYADAEKSSTAYGDWLIWRQLLDHAKLANTPIVLVTDDKKDDWWLLSGIRPVAPRPELIEEMAAEAHVPFYMYQPDQFLQDVGQAVKQVASGRAIKEVASLPPIAAGRRVLTGVDLDRSRTLALVLQRRAKLQHDLAVVTDALGAIPTGQSVGRRRREQLLILKNDLSAQLEASEQEERATRSAAHWLYSYVGDPSTGGGVFLESGGSVDGLAPDAAVNMIYPVTGEHWLHSRHGPGVTADEEMTEDSNAANGLADD